MKRVVVTPVRLIIRISSRSIAVRKEPGKYEEILCQLMKDVFVNVSEEKSIESVTWLRVSCGWICTMDSNGFQCYNIAHEQEANSSWTSEFDNRRRISAALSAVLVRSNSLTTCKQIAKSILVHAKRTDLKPIINLPDVSFEDLLIGLANSGCLKQTEVFEFIRVAASQQSNPVKAVVDICENIHTMMGLRPTLWVLKDVPVLETEDRKRQNDNFVMAAAKGDLNTIQMYFDKGQELAAIHSEMKYTALHAAADFGYPTVVQKLLSSGMSLNIRDARKGQTALHYAAQSGRCEIVSLLLDHGADRHITNHRGQLPFQLAQDQGQFECREMLKFVPLEIESMMVTEYSSSSITLSWGFPKIDEDCYAKIIEYMVDWKQMGTNHENQIRTPHTFLTIKNLQPSTGYEFMVFSRSIAGWSPPSTRIIHFTLMALPDTPPDIEFLKVSLNSIAISWHPPPKDNGGIIDYYNIEIISQKALDLKNKDEEVWLQSPILGKSIDKNIREENRVNVMETKPLKPRLHQIHRSAIEYSFSNEKELSFTPNLECVCDPPTSSSPPRDIAPFSPCTHESIQSISSPSPSLNFSPSNLERPEVHAGGGDDASEISAFESAAEDLSIISKSESSSSRRRRKPIRDEGGGDDGITHDGMTTSSDDSSLNSASKLKKRFSSSNYRFIKHTDIINRVRTIVGLTPNMPYFFRLRCHNSLGFSPWSPWCGPLSPHSPIVATEYSTTNFTSKIKWFAPSLSCGRTVLAYELRACEAHGPITSTFEVYKRKELQIPPMKSTLTDTFSDQDEASLNSMASPDPRNKQDSKSTSIDSDPNEITSLILISNEIPTNEYLLSNLRPGRRYQCRVRAKLCPGIHGKNVDADGGEWIDWVYGQVSDTLVMPSSIPDPPYDVRPVVKEECKFLFEDPSNNGEGDLSHEFEGLSASIDKSTPSQERRYSRTEKSNKHENTMNSTLNSLITSFEKFEVYHDRIMIQWESGQPNGSSLSGFEIQAIKIRDYRQEDVLYASAIASSSMLNTSELESISFSQLVEPGRVELLENVKDFDMSEFLESTFFSPHKQVNSATNLEAIAPDTSHKPELLVSDPSNSNRQTRSTRYRVDSISFGLGNVPIEADYSNDSPSQLDMQQQPRRIGNTKPKPRVWKDVTTQGTALGPRAFSVTGLTPGCSFLFRVRQKNSNGWSDFSRPTPLITTYPCLPPIRPQILEIGSGFVLIRWAEESPDGLNLGMSVLDYYFEVATLEFGYKSKNISNNAEITCNEDASPLMISTPWSQTLCRTLTQVERNALLDRLKLKKDPNAETGTVPCVDTGSTGIGHQWMYGILDRLLASTHYALRLRSRTMAGLSPWSPLSLQFCTLGVP